MKKQDELTRQLVETVGKRIAAGESSEVNRWAQEIVRKAAEPPEKQQETPDKVRKAEGWLRDYFRMMQCERDMLQELAVLMPGREDARFIAAIRDIREDPFFAVLVCYYGEGLSNRECADRLFYDERTLRRHRKQLVQQLTQALD